MIARLMFAIVSFAARNGLAESATPDTASVETVKRRARHTGVRGETYAYWYLRRHGYVLVARNFTSPGLKGEIDMVGYDGPVLAFIEVKTRSESAPGQPRPEDAVNWDKRRNLSRVARQFLRSRRIKSAPCRFDVLAIETCPSAKPIVRLHKGAFNANGF